MRAATIALAWDPSASPDVAGYRLYEGVVSQTYTNVVDVGNVTNSSLGGLIQGTKYFFAVTAYDIIGLESAFSNEISYEVPTSGAAQLQISFSATGEPIILASGPAGFQYALEVSQDLSNWVEQASITLDSSGRFQYTDSTAASGTNRFYRLRQLTPAAQSIPMPAPATAPN